MEQQNIFEPIEIEVSVPDSGIVLKEKSEVAVQKEAKTSLEAEEVMKKMIGKAQESIDTTAPRFRTGLLLRKRSEQHHVELYKELLKEAGAKEIVILPTDVPADMLEIEESRCKIIVSIKEQERHVEQ